MLMSLSTPQMFLKRGRYDATYILGGKCRGDCLGGGRFEAERDLKEVCPLGEMGSPEYWGWCKERKGRVGDLGQVQDAMKRRADRI